MTKKSTPIRDPASPLDRKTKQNTEKMLKSSLLLLFILFITQINAFYPHYISNLLIRSKLHSNKYHIEGIKCKSCEAKVINILKQYDNNATLLSKNVAQISPNATLDVINTALQTIGVYRISQQQQSQFTNIIQQIIKFTPLIQVITLITILTILLQMYLPIPSSTSSIMTDFMGIFFIIFSLFKLINIKQFVISFQNYDYLSQKFKYYALLYPFIELIIGIIYLLYRDSAKITVKFPLHFVNTLTAIIMSISSINIYNIVYVEKRNIQCACLGGNTQLPMTYISILENAVMAVMAIYNLFIFKWKIKVI